MTNTPLSSKDKKIVFGVMFVFFVIIIALIAIAISSSTEDTSDYEEERDASLQKEKEVAKFVYDYKGKDGKGTTIGETLAVVINVAYPNENILKNPSTVTSLYAFEDLTKKEGVYIVYFDFKTYREETEFIWYVDTKTNKIFAGNEGAKSILDAVDSFD